MRLGGDRQVAIDFLGGSGANGTTKSKLGEERTRGLRVEKTHDGCEREHDSKGPLENSP